MGAAKKLLIVFVVFGLLTFSSAPLVFSQDGGGGVICYGWHSIDPNNRAAVTGTITAGEVAQNWRFTGKAGTMVTIRMAVTDGSLDPFLYVTDGQTGERLVSGSANDLSNQKIVTIQEFLKTDGSHVITATRLGEAMGSSTGSYRLTLELGPPVKLSQVYEDGDNSYTQFNHLIYDGAVVRGSIPAGRHFDAWYFQGSAGQRVTAVLTGVQDTQLVPDDTILAIWWNNVERNRWDQVAAIGAVNGNEMRLINYGLPSNGDYMVVVDANDTPLSNYQLTFAGAGGPRPDPPPCGDPLPSCPATSPLGVPASQILNIVPQSGGVTVSTPIVPFQFPAFANNSVSVTMQRTGGNLDTLLGILDQNGNVLVRDESTDPAKSVIANFTIPADGCYYIFASREDVDAGTTEGTFSIVAQGIPQGDDTPQPPRDMAFGGDINSGETATQTITSDNWRVAYRFRADGKTYRAIATRINGDLKPGLMLLDAEHNPISQVSASFAGNVSNPLVFATQEGAYYFIVVQREGGVGGTNSGDFTLTVNLNPN